MTKNPLINAVSATAYIVLVVSIMNFITQTRGSEPDTPFAPVIFLLLLTLSASVMAFIFFYQPLQLLIDGKKKEALKLFTQTIGAFAAITLVGLVVLFLGLI